MPVRRGSVPIATGRRRTRRRSGATMRVARNEPAPRRPARPGSLLRWVEGHVSFRGDRCLIWPFASNIDGYGSIKIAGKQHRVPRLMCRLNHGAPPTQAHETAHSCGVPACCNPQHLRWATHIENEQDKLIHGTRARGSRQGLSKLTSADVLEIRRRAASGEMQKNIAKDFGIAQPTVSTIHTRQKWSWL